MRRQKNSRTMDSLFVFILFGGLISSILALQHPADVIDNHYAELQNIFNKFDAMVKLNTVESAVTENNSETPVICISSLDEIIEIKDALVRNGDHFFQTNDVKIHFSAKCPLLDRLKAGVVKLKYDFIHLISERIFSRKYNELKINFESKFTGFKNHLAAKQKIASNKDLEIIGKLQNELESQQTRIADTLTNLESDQKSVNDAYVHLVISQLQQDQLDEAAYSFLNISDHEFDIEKIVPSVYQNNDDNFEKIHHFIGLIPSLANRITGYKALHKQLKDNKHLLNANFWTLAAAVKNISEPTGEVISDVMTDLRTIVRKNYFDGIIGYLNNRSADGQDTLTHIAPLFIRTIYEESGRSIEKVLNIVRMLNFTQHRFYLINELITMLKSNDHMHGKEIPLIIFELIKLRTMNEEEIKEPQYKSLQKKIERNLPEELRDIMYKNLCIQNVENDEFLFASIPADEKRRHIYTAKTQLLKESYSWEINFVENGTKALIQSRKYREHLYLMDEGKRDDVKDDVHVLRSWIPNLLVGDRQAEFTLNMVEDGQFLIINNHFGQLLYSPYEGVTNHNYNRPIFSKKYDPDNVSIDSKWKFGICRVPVDYVF